MTKRLKVTTGGEKEKESEKGIKKEKGGKKEK